MHIIKKYFIEAKTAPYECHACNVTNTTENNSEFWKCYNCGERKKYSDHLDVSVMRRNEDGTIDKVGEYRRNYHTMYNTFFPFKQDDKEYALVSNMYTGTSVISLPDCKFILDPEWKCFGFCPTGFYVPSKPGKISSLEEIVEYTEKDPFNGQIGFVCGCVWGDDGSWKIQVIDLSRLSEGKINIEPRFGYCQSPYSSDDLFKAIEVTKYSDKFCIDVTSYDTHYMKLGSSYTKEEEPTFSEVCDAYKDIVSKAANRLATKLAAKDSMTEEEIKSEQNDFDDLVSIQFRHFYDEIKKFAKEDD